MEQMSEIVKDADYHQIQHFISESPWNARTVMDSVAEDTNKLFNDFEEVYFLIDESAHTKKGTKSVGVSRQYSGQLGKVDNCQVAVYGALSAGKYCSLVDADYTCLRNGHQIKAAVNPGVFPQLKSSIKPS
jgi:SRSO17 transposase